MIPNIKKHKNNTKPLSNTDEHSAKDTNDPMQLHLYKQLTASIAHELRSPLMSVSNGINSIDKMLPKLIEAYEICKTHELSVPFIPDVSVHLLKNTIAICNQELHAAHHAINLLLSNGRQGHFGKQALIAISIVNVIQDILKQYPFKQKQLEKVHLDLQDDFIFKGDFFLIRQIIFNLIKNALYYIAKKPDAKIYIKTVANKNNHTLLFKDTGSGIDKDTLPYIFDLFYGQTYHGVGLGLYYCKKVMEDIFSGNISCQSIKGEYTEFSLVFPSVKEDKD